MDSSCVILNQYEIRKDKRPLLNVEEEKKPRKKSIREIFCIPKVKKSDKTK